MGLGVGAVVGAAAATRAGLAVGLAVGPNVGPNVGGAWVAAAGAQVPRDLVAQQHGTITAGKFEKLTVAIPPIHRTCTFKDQRTVIEELRKAGDESSCLSVGGRRDGAGGKARGALALPIRLRRGQYRRRRRHRLGHCTLAVGLGACQLHPGQDRAALSSCVTLGLWCKLEEPGCLG